MKNILKLGLAAMAVAALAACGGGGSSEPSDKYVGNWKSKCFPSVANDGKTYHYFYLYNYAKVSAGELAITGTYKAHSDAACGNVVGNFTANPRKINIGAETTFLGAKSDSIVSTDISSGEAFPGFATANDSSLNIVTYDPARGLPTGWGSASPYTKQ